jgi:glycosyltransferase involved in cell wall biosynthesis
MLSVVIPARNERDRLAPTIASFISGRTSATPLEFVIVDDASTDGCCTRLADELPSIQAPAVSIRVIRLAERVGVPCARNVGGFAASGEILFITDAHVAVSSGWDEVVLSHVLEDRILAASIADPASQFHAYGCTLAVPFMGTHWVRGEVSCQSEMQIAACPGTVLYNSLFRSLGGYDSGMRLYSGAEPEFSVRAWLAGAEIIAVPELVISHRFKTQEERRCFLDELRPSMIHNSLRFGVLYLNERAVMQVIRYFALKFPRQVQEAVGMVLNSNVWDRRSELQSKLTHSFDWFAERFEVTDDVGRRVLS